MTIILFQKMCFTANWTLLKRISKLSQIFIKKHGETKELKYIDGIRYRGYCKVCGRLYYFLQLIYS